MLRGPARQLAVDRGAAAGGTWRAADRPQLPTLLAAFGVTRRPINGRGDSARKVVYSSRGANDAHAAVNRLTSISTAQSAAVDVLSIRTRNMSFLWGKGPLPHESYFAIADKQRRRPAGDAHTASTRTPNVLYRALQRVVCSGPLISAGSCTDYSTLAASVAVLYWATGCQQCTF